MILKLVRTPGIFLVGFMACGKTTVGKLLADRLGWSFVDLDKEIEAEQKISISQIFDQYGEDYFRKLETEAIRKRTRMVRSGQPMVVALGGGAFARPENLQLVEDYGVTMWLDCRLEMVQRRVESSSDRPLARDPGKFDELFEARRPYYARADYHIEVTSDDPAVVVESICALPIFK